MKINTSVIKQAGAFFLTILILTCMHSEKIFAQDRRQNPPTDRRPPQQQPSVRPSPNHHQTPVQHPPAQRPPQQRPPVQQPPQNRPPQQRPPQQRPPANRPPNHHQRPPVNHRPAGWGNNRPAYTRPPHIFRGRRYYSYHHYYYHPYRPFVFGPTWHPIGFFTRTLAAAAFIITFNSIQYHCADGVYYVPDNGGYQVVAPPLGAIISGLPNGYATINVGGIDYFYYGGTFYIATPDGYQIVQAPPGAIVYNLPDGCQQIQAGNNITYLMYNNAYFQPIEYNGQNAYEVVEIE